MRTSRHPARSLLGVAVLLVAASAATVVAHPDHDFDHAPDHDAPIEVELDLGLDGRDDGAPGALGTPWPGDLAPANAVVIGPSIERVLQAAYRAAALDTSPVAGWTRRARLAGLVPVVSARTARNTRWQVVDPDVDHGTTLEVRATWRLDRLVFDGRELQAAAIDAARRRERRRLASQVIALYFEWRRAAAAAATQPRYLPRAEVAAAQLDALTDGAFSDELAVARARRPSAHRTAGR